MRIFTKFKMHILFYPTISLEIYPIDILAFMCKDVHWSVVVKQRERERERKSSKFPRVAGSSHRS